VRRNVTVQQQRPAQPQRKQIPSQRIFTASEVAEYEYCPLAWWYEQYEPLVSADTEELFARMVELEHEHGPQATTLPEYQVIEQLLVRRGAFEQGLAQHRAHAQAVAEISEERVSALSISDQLRQMIRLVIIAIAVLAIACMIAALLFASH
jgi:hypothetical protein